MSSNFEIKGGAKGTHWDQYIISADQLANYLSKDILGLPIKADFVTLHGPAGGCFVEMNISIDNADFTTEPAQGNYVENFLAKNSTGIQAKQDVINALKPFMFPSDWTRILSDPIKLRDLAAVGIVGDALQRIRQFAIFRKSETYNAWVITLNTENLIRDFFSNPTTGKVEGDLKITSVTGDRAPGIQWEVFINRDNTRTVDNTISIDAIFNSIR